MNYSLLHYGSQSHILNSLMNIQHRTGELSQSPALPELARSSFQQLSNDLSMTMNMYRDGAERDMMAGAGPNSMALRSIQRFLKVETLADLGHLAVTTDFTAEIDIDRELASRVWSQFFRYSYPTELFKRGEGQRSKALFYEAPFHNLQNDVNRHLIGKVTVELEAEVNEDDPWPQTSRIKCVHVEYSPADGFWTAFTTIDAKSVIYIKDIRIQANVIHHVEQASCSFDIQGATEFMQWFIVDNLRSMLGFKFDDFEQEAQPMFHHDVIGIMDDVVKAEPQYAHEHLFNRIVRECAVSGRDTGLDIDVPDVGSVRIVVGRNDWDSYTKYREECKKYHWARDYPLIKVEQIMSLGTNVLSRRRPRHWDDKIAGAVIEAFSAIVEKAKTESYYKRLDPDYVKPEE